jgi:hypothetical protein
VVGLRCCWPVLGAPTGMRLAPVMGELVATLRRFGELDVSSDVAAALTVVSPATTPATRASDSHQASRASGTFLASEFMSWLG